MKRQLIVLIVALFFVGCQKNTFDLAQTPASKNAPKYTVQAEKNGGTSELPAPSEASN